MQPIDYSINMPDPTQAFLAGVKERQVLDQLQQQRMAAQQQQLAQQQIQQVLNNPAATNEDRARIVAMLPPQVSAQLNSVWERAGKEQQQAMLSFDSQVFSALENNRPELAVQLYEERATALENSGRTQEAASLRKQAEMAQQAPTLARNLVAMRIDASPGGKDFWEGYAKRGAEGRAQAMAPAALREAEAKATGAEAEATTKGVAAKYAESQAVADLEKKGWDIKAIRADIDFKRESNRIAAMNAALAREGNDLKRQELKLKIDDAVRARDEKLREKVAVAESGASAIDNMLNTVERVKKNPGLNDVLGSIEGRLPSILSDSGADAIAMIETLGSQAFLAQVPNIKGMGALSNAEGDKLQNALQNLGRTQSEGQFRANLEEAARLLRKGRDSLAKSTGVPLGKPDTPAAPGARPPLDSFNRGG